MQFHDFNRLLADDAYAIEMLADADCVVSNVGPHAHYYFYLRERLALSYRIVRDVRTAIWSSYLFQEYLCHPFLRQDDTILVSSFYAQGVYEAFFPLLASFPALRCYPLAACFADRRLVRRKRFAKADSGLILGYLGRISEDKNFPDLIRLLIDLNSAGASTSHRRFTLFACGHVHSSRCTPQLVEQELVEALGSSDVFRYFPPRAHAEIWDFLAEIDVLLFPSTSNLETLGRVLIEASYAGLPVICGDHAAASELVDPGYLCPVRYDKGRIYDCHNDHSLGRVDLEWMKRCLLADELRPATCFESYRSHPGRFLDALSATGADLMKLSEPLVLTESQLAFIRSIRISMPSFPHRSSEALNLTGSLIPWFLGLQGLMPQVPRSNWVDRLVRLTKHPDRTARFIERTRDTNRDFTDVGAIDIELCNVAKFLPTFSLD
ncbi:MAG: glycosyltransferase family 4 protein [Cyanobium sp. CZS 48M]|nr:glycosyltransferase family 4 protein [Cyanobium sp. CZS48M]